MREELDLVLGTRTDVEPVDLIKLKYTSCVFKETLRLWSPIGLFSRESLPDFSINNYKIPDKSWIQVNNNF